ncbi:hypothetical protein [Thalassotalea marina]|uniref:Uncharacterized protein n=1 Tax=Thalassotalea marina TaxID=1673741 RepID=A0A919BM10_9GAMM|nr:hypothetical protein [Thalassotalea marina]GHF96375.1 hypothetical protein GCM10017161_25920 [Thalassotalea marina]
MTSIVIEQLRNKIRFAHEPNNPLLINLWLSEENFALSAINNRQTLRKQYEAQFRLLLETIVDELLPEHWRRCCLDHIYQPISSLQKLADSDKSQRHIRQLMAELNISCQYVSHSL